MIWTSLLVFMIVRRSDRSFIKNFYLFPWKNCWKLKIDCVPIIKYIITKHFIIQHLQGLFIINMTVTWLSRGSTALIVFIKQRAASLLQTIWCWIVGSGWGCVGQPQWIPISREGELPLRANSYTPDQLKVGCISPPCFTMTCFKRRKEFKIILRVGWNLLFQLGIDKCRVHRPR